MVGSDTSTPGTLSGKSTSAMVNTATPAKKRKCANIVSPPNLTHEDIIIVDDLDAVGDVQIVDDVEIVQRASV